MTKFEFFMAFYGLVLGLSLTELLSGFGKLLRRRERPEWGLLTPLAGAVVFICIVTAFGDAWSSMQNISIDLRAFSAPLAIGMCLFLAALMATPDELEGWDGLDAYFFARRRLIFLPLIAYSLVLIFALELPKNLPKHGPGLAYVVVNTILLGLLALAAFARSRCVVAAAMGTYLVVMVLIYSSGGSIQQQVTALLNGQPPSRSAALPPMAPKSPNAR